MPAPDLLAHAFLQEPSRPVRLFLHANHATPADFEGSTTIVVDAIRATTTITAALVAGAAAVVPVLTVEDALAERRRLEKAGSADVLLGGERGGVLIPGFDLDNSPRSYTPERVAGKTVVFTTANGTAGLLLAARAKRILIGAFVNVKAVAEAAAATSEQVNILCCGTRQDVSLDDCLAGGAIAERLVTLGCELMNDDAARLCIEAWRRCESVGRPLARALAETRGGRYLHLQGCEGDLEVCADVDRFGVAPIFDATKGQITI